MPALKIAAFSFSALTLVTLCAGETLAQAKPTPAAPAPQGDARQLTREQRTQAYEKFLVARRYVLQNDTVNAVETFKQVIALDPAAAAPHIELGNLYLDARNLVEAEAEARKAVAVEADNAGGHWLLGRVLFAQAAGASINKEKARESVAEFEKVSKLDKLNFDVYRLLGRLYRSLGDTDNAILAYNKLMGNNVAGPEEFEAVTEMYFQKRRYRDAANSARQAFILSGENPQWGYRLSQALLNSGQTAEAADVLKTLLDENPGNVRLILSYAQALMRGGKYEEATTQVKRILAERPDEPEALGILAQIQRRSGKRDDAVKTLQQSLKGQDVTESLGQQFALAETLVELGRIEDGVAAYETALKSVSNPDQSVSESERERAEIILTRIAIAYKAGGQEAKELATYDRMRKTLGENSTVADQLTIEALRSEGKLSEAITASREARKRFPKEKQFVYLEAQSLAKTGKTDQAMELLRQIPNEPGTKDDGEMAQIAAIVLMEGNRLEDAEKQARSAVQADDKNAAYLVTLSSVLDKRKAFKESESLLRTVLSLDPDNPTALNNLGYFLSERNERLDEALALVQRAVNIDPTNSSFLDSLGWVYYRQNRLPQAKQYIEQALGYDKRNATLHDHLGDVLDKLGDTEGAKKHWQTARGLATDPEDIARIEAKLRKGTTATTQK
jgi:tetratricopeptide (TPR) repeat protein